MTEVYNYNISDELYLTLEDEFNAEKIAKKYAESKSDSDFEEYGKNLMKRTMELGDLDKYKDRTYELLLEKSEKLGGRFYFPHVPQRFLEIAYLSVHLMPIVKIITSNAQELSFKVDDGECSIYKSLQPLISEDGLKALPCQKACLSCLKTVFDDLKMDVDLKMPNKMPEDGFCLFEVIKR